MRRRIQLLNLREHTQHSDPEAQTDCPEVARECRQQQLSVPVAAPNLASWPVAENSLLPPLMLPAVRTLRHLTTKQHRLALRVAATVQPLPDRQHAGGLEPIANLEWNTLTSTSEALSKCSLLQRYGPACAPRRRLFIGVLHPCSGPTACADACRPDPRISSTRATCQLCDWLAHPAVWPGDCKAQKQRPRALPAQRIRHLGSALVACAATAVPLIAVASPMNAHAERKPQIPASAPGGFQVHDVRAEGAKRRRPGQSWDCGIA